VSEHRANLSQLCSEATPLLTSPQAREMEVSTGETHQPLFISDKKETASIYCTSLVKTSEFQLILPDTYFGTTKNFRFIWTTWLAFELHRSRTTRNLC